MSIDDIDDFDDVGLEPDAECTECGELWPVDAMKQAGERVVCPLCVDMGLLD